MVERHDIYALLSLINRQIEFMNDSMFYKQVEEKQIKFCNFWNKKKFNITIDIEDTADERKEA